MVQQFPHNLINLYKNIYKPVDIAIAYILPMILYIMTFNIIFTTISTGDITRIVIFVIIAVILFFIILKYKQYKIVGYTINKPYKELTTQGNKKNSLIYHPVSINIFESLIVSQYISTLIMAPNDFFRVVTQLDTQFLMYIQKLAPSIIGMPLIFLYPALAVVTLVWFIQRKKRSNFQKILFIPITFIYIGIVIWIGVLISISDITLKLAEYLEKFDYRVLTGPFLAIILSDLIYGNHFDRTNAIKDEK